MATSTEQQTPFYQSFRTSETDQNYSDRFILSDILYNAVNNEYWQDKKGLWAVLSATCNEAGQEFYVQMRKYVQNLTDIDVCNIHSLISLANSTNCSEHVEFLKDLHVPDELLKLINLFSIKSSILLDQSKVLNHIVTYPKGSLDIRNMNILPEKFSIDLMYEIYESSKVLYNLIINSKYDISKTCMSYYAVVTPTENYDDLIIYDYQNKDLYHDSTESVTLNNILETIIHLDDYLKTLNKCYIFEDPNLSLHEFLKKCAKLTQTIETNNSNKHIVNPFYMLTMFIKNQFIETDVTDKHLQSTYYDVKTNTIIDKTQLILKMFQTIQNDDPIFIKHYIFFHIYGLFVDKLNNPQLKNQYAWNDYQPNFVLLGGQITKQSFQAKVNGYISNIELEQFEKEHIHFKNAQVQFIQYLSIINSILEPENKFQFKPYKFNNSFSFDDKYNASFRRLFGLTR